MNKKVKVKWLKALRSDQYVQGQDALCTTNSVDKFCCLGVLCNVRAEGNKKLIWKQRECDTQGELAFLGDSLGLPNSMLKWAGLTIEQTEKLADMNDTGKSFSTIADYIEETL